MAVIKVACPKCGQRVSGDESFYGTSVECPICTSQIQFPSAPEGKQVSTSTAPSREAPLPSTNPDAPAQKETTSIPLPPRRTESIPAAPAPLPEGETDELPSPVLGVTSMVFGIVSVMLFCAPGILLGPAAIISGHIARARARPFPSAKRPGYGAALTGLILGYLSLIGFIILILSIKPAMDWLRETRPPE